MQISSNDKSVRNDTIEDLKEFNSESLTTQAKKGEQLVLMMPAIKKAFSLLGDDIIELSTENDALKNKIGSYDDKCLEESKNKMLEQIDDEKRATWIMFRLKKQMEKQQISYFVQIKLRLLLFKWLKYLIINFGKVNFMVLFLKEINYKI